MMSYESPIRIIEGELTSRFENDIMTVVQSYGIEIDKDRLLRALKYDSDQYDKGYRDGKNFRLSESAKPYKDGTRWHCGECSSAVGRFWKYCQKCGQKIGWEEVSDE